MPTGYQGGFATLCSNERDVRVLEAHLGLGCNVGTNFQKRSPSQPIRTFSRPASSTAPRKLGFKGSDERYRLPSYSTRLAE